MQLNSQMLIIGVNSEGGLWWCDMFLYWSVLLVTSEEDTEDLVIKLRNDKAFQVVNAWGGKFNTETPVLSFKKGQ